MPATAACASLRSAAYRRREPERTLLYRTVQTHLATWLALQEDGAGACAPAVIERVLRQHSPGAREAPRLGAVIFIHRFGALLNTHLHFHCVVVDGVFEVDAEGGAAFHSASGLDAAASGEVQTAVRRRLLRSAQRRGLLSAGDAQGMAEWEHSGGFSVDAEVRIEAHEREGLERLLRYCARPAFALDRLREIDPERLVYESVKPGPGGSVSLMLTPMQLLDRLAALIPPPRKHRHRYYGVLAPNSPLREAVTALAQPAEIVAAPAPVEPMPPEAVSAEPLHRQAARYVWALLLARIYEVLPLLCPQCGREMKIIAFITEGPAIGQILGHLGEPTSPPRLMPARGPPLWEMQDNAPGEIDLQAQPAPDYEFDQRIAW
ncbi:transposase [Accumulibacter sp.]|uniref:transposase n=1 Tax=Accumulibacter sp. TaxID=2053492 RepID=UPI0025DE558C|nr:transposase [Accumulibacter sp.]MCM8614066.1 transposase [Accumulibacter sp.]MCM8637839.1 transposase [Accumulibacter sp.]MCM8641184.1 transposase [Accumulibacter sp.]